jgi:hypothetical protein
MNNISRHYPGVKFFLPLIFLSLSFSARAADEPVAQESTPIAPTQQGPQIWLTSGFLSYHFKRDAGYNEQNTGLGAELYFDDSNVIAAGIYRNSVRRTSHYLQYAWTPLSVGRIRLGAAIGLIDGYPKLRGGKVALSIMPIASYHFKAFDHDAGLNLVYIPTVAPRVDGALALQLKIRLR